MSFDTTLALKNAAAATVTFNRLTGDSSKAVYQNSATGVSDANKCEISHQMSTASDGSDRHLIKFTKLVMDANLRPRTAVLNVTLAAPRVGITRTHIDDLIAEAKEFLVTANVDRIMRGEL